MIRVMLAAMLLVAIAAPAEAAALPDNRAHNQAYNPDGDADLATLKVILNMLRESLSTMKDIDELEQIGMPESEVELMREALLQKIETMKQDALRTIQNL